DRRLRALGRRLRIVDLGAHIGLFGARVLSLYPTAQVTAFVPDPLNRSLLEQAAVRSRRSWTVVGAPAWTENTTLPFRSGEFAASQIDWSATERVAAVDVFPYL